MQATAIVREAWELYKAHWKAFVPLALVVFVIIGLISLLLTWALGLVGALIGGLLAIVGFFWLQGALVEAVRDVRDGKRDLSIGETFARVRPRLPAIIPAGLLAGLGIILGLILLIVPGLFLLTIWSMIIPVIVLEGRSAGESFGRSRELVRGNGWNVFGVIVITVLLSIAANIVVAILTFWLPEEARSFVQNVISNTVVAPFMAVALTLTYFALARPTTAEQSFATPAPPAPPPA
jgi:ABC-type multidrug transport system fused ATPase/permease subunit